MYDGKYFYFAPKQKQSTYQRPAEKPERQYFPKERRDLSERYARQADQTRSLRLDGERWAEVLQVWADCAARNDDYEDVCDALYGVVEDIVNRMLQQPLMEEVSDE